MQHNLACSILKPVNLTDASDLVMTMVKTHMYLRAFVIN